MTTLLEETYEAVCGALHGTDWQMIGEQGASAWWVRGTERGKRVRVEVQKSTLAPTLIVNVEWHVTALAPQLLRGRTTLQVGCDPAKDTRSEVEAATQQVVLRCLEIFRDVLEGKGVAGSEAAGKMENRR